MPEKRCGGCEFQCVLSTNKNFPQYTLYCPYGNLEDKITMKRMEYICEGCKENCHLSMFCKYAPYKCYFKFKDIQVNFYNKKDQWCFEK